LDTRCAPYASVFCKIKQLLGDHKLVNFNTDEVLEILLLVGGTERQEPHFDNTRIFGFARKQDEEGRDETLKSSYKDLHEINRKWYNEEVMRSNGPASMIFDLTERRCGVLLGVLTQFLNVEGDTASVKHGVPGEKFALIENGDKYSVIRIEGAGVVFAGDFPHFGVRNIAKSEKSLNKTMMKVFDGVQKIKTKNDKNNEACFNLFKTTPAFNELCRLFVKVRPKNTKFELYDLDAVGAITKQIVEEKTYDYPKD
jgi:hypothetical protein